MHDVTNEDFEEVEYTGPSKSEKKRQVQALQQLGEELVKLSEGQLAAIELPRDLHKAVIEAKRIQHKHAAFKRQRLFIGKLMRQVDAEPIQQALAALEARHNADSAAFHRSEQWRERLLTDNAALSEFIGQYPHTDRQHLRQLLQKAQREYQASTGKGAQRALFRFVHEVIEQAE